MNIVCGTDFSESSNSASRLAAGLARRFGDKLVLAHVFEPWVVGSLSVNTRPLIELEQHSQAEAKRRLEAQAAGLRAEGLSVEALLLEGRPASALISAAEDVRLFVIGGSKQSELAGDLSMRASRPVLVAASNSVNLTAWPTAQRPLRVLVALDDTLTSDSALSVVADLRRTLPIELTVAHLYWPPSTYERLGLGGDRDYFAADPEAVRIMHRETADRVATAFGDISCRFSIEPHWGRIGPKLADLARKHQVDLIVCGTHQRSALGRIVAGSVSREILTLGASVLCVPPLPTNVGRERSVPELRQVLAATDFSDMGDEATLQAYAGVRPGGIVHLLHVIPSPSAESRHGESLRDDTRRELERKLLARAPADAELYGVDTRAHVVSSQDVPTAIVQTATRLGVDQICVASHGRRGVTRVALGSVAEQVMRTSDRPVVVVRRREP